MKQLDGDSVGPFLERFQNFYDSTVTCTVISYSETRAKSSVEVSVGAIDNNSDAPSSVIVRMQFTGSPEFTIREEPNKSYAVPGDGARISIFNGRIYLDLDTLEGDDDTVESFRASNFYLAGDRCTWEVTPWC